MPETNRDSATTKLAVVTGANKGIGLEICRQLATIGVIVVLTATDKKKGVEDVEKLKGSGLSDVVFHQLDVMDPASIASLADFIKTQFGKLDILVNNAGIVGVKLDDEAIRVIMAVDGPPEARLSKYMELARPTHVMAEECIQAKYYGAKSTNPTLLNKVNKPNFVEVSSSAGKLQNVIDTWAKEVLSDEDGLTEERVDDVLNKFLQDFKDSQGWPSYIMSKVALNAYTRILAKKLPEFYINCVCPGYVKTDINHNTGNLLLKKVQQVL